MSKQLVEVELNRVLTRLSHMNPRDRAQSVALVHATVSEIRALAIACGDSGPREVPNVGSGALGSQLQLMCTDLIKVADDASLEMAAAQLIELRRALP